MLDYYTYIEGGVNWQKRPLESPEKEKPPPVGSDLFVYGLWVLSFPAYPLKSHNLLSTDGRNCRLVIGPKEPDRSELFPPLPRRTEKGDPMLHLSDGLGVN